MKKYIKTLILFFGLTYVSTIYATELSDYVDKSKCDQIIDK